MNFFVMSSLDMTSDGSQLSGNDFSRSNHQSLRRIED